jgi:hypothetical protein
MCFKRPHPLLQLRYLSLVASACAVFQVSATAQLINLTSISYSAPTGSASVGQAGSSGDPFTDDVLLDSVTFGTVTMTAAGGQIQAIQSAYVESGRDNINAEWGDDDDNSDGNPDPFARIGVNVYPGGTLDTHS